SRLCTTCTLREGTTCPSPRTTSSIQARDAQSTNPITTKIDSQTSKREPRMVCFFSSSLISMAFNSCVDQYVARATQYSLVPWAREHQCDLPHSYSTDHTT